MIKRDIENSILERLFKGKVLLIFGPRQVGKTTLIKKIGELSGVPYLYLNGDEPDIRSELKNASSGLLKNLFGKHQLILIDEAQRIENIGLTIKLAFDTLPNVQIIASGSSSFELANVANEPLTGRKIEYHLFPFSITELIEANGLLNEKRLLSQRLIYGSYPDVVNNPGEEIQLLNQLTNSYLYKDLFALDGIKKNSLFENLAKALALQLGQEVSYSELSKLLGVDKNTIEKYLNLMEQAFIIFRLPALNRNVRNEIKKGKKYYFYDNGVRNSILADFNSLELRTDKGSLWENYLISERWKTYSYQALYGHRYFWRTTQQQEIDYIEERDAKMYAFEFKWDSSKKARIPLTFSNAYPNHEFEFVHSDNYLKFLGVEYN